MSDEPTRAELESHLHYYQNRATESEPRLAAAEARIRELEGAARAVLADHAERLEAYGEENEGQPYRVKVMADLCTALNPPPGDEKRGGE